MQPIHIIKIVLAIGFTSLANNSRLIYTWSVFPPYNMC
jgi:hypothetical protein